MFTRYNKYVWIDCEMTGLNPERDTILEIAVVVTDNRLELIDSGVEFCIKDGLDNFIRNGDPFVVDMHTNSNLIRDIRKKGMNLMAVQKKVLSYIRSHIEPGEAPICGSTVYMDRNFLWRYMKNIVNYLDYHVVDVASWRIIINRLKPDLIEKRIGHVSEHRAMSDIIYSIMELKGFLRTLNLI